MNNPFLTIDARLSNIENLLLEIKHSPTRHPQAETDQLLTVPQAAAFLSLSVPTVYTLISKGKIPCMKRSKKVYFSKTELMDYLRKGKKKAVTEIDTDTDAYLATRKQRIANSNK